MNFEEEIRKLIKTEKIRKTLPDKVDIKLPRIMMHSLQWVSVGYASALYFAGKRLGKEILSSEIESGDLKKILNCLGNLFEKYGMGKMEVKDIGDKSITICLKECSTCYKMDSIGKPVCFFESGLIAGIIEAKTNKKTVVNETVCGGLGDEEDEFLVRIG